MIKDWVKGLLGINELEKKIHDTNEQLEQEKKKAAELAAELKKHEQPSEKELATQAKEPYISILSVEVDPNQPGNGSFELDWNEYFVQKLMRSGYQGKTDEQIVDQWFQDVCRHVVMETYEQYEANQGARVLRRDIGNGRSEVS